MKSRLAFPIMLGFGLAMIVSSSHAFDLFGNLDGEFVRLAGILTAHGAGKDIIEAGLKAWIMALQTMIKRPESEELSAPLISLFQRITSLWARAEVTPPQLEGPALRLHDCLLGRNRRLDARRMEAAVAGIYPLLRAELFLHSPVDALPEAMAAVVSVLTARGLMRRNPETGRYAAPEPTSQSFAELRQLGEAIRPTLERHFLTLALLQRHGSGRLTRRALEEASHLLAQRLALLYEFDAPEFSEKSLFAGFIGHLLDAGILREDEAGLLEFDERITVPAAQAELVLSAEVRQTILRMAGETVQEEQ